MSHSVPVCYSYDGSFGGFLCCVWQSRANQEYPESFTSPEDTRVSLYPERTVVTDRAVAGRVYALLERELGPEGRRLATSAFLTCLSEREQAIFDFLMLGFEQGPSAARNLTDDRVDLLRKAVLHLNREVEHFKGFVRFSDQGWLLAGEIEPKNRVLPLLRNHFCTRFSGETFLLHDRTHREVLLYQPGRKGIIIPAEDFRLDAPGEAELCYRRLWRRFYDTISIEGRYNPKLRMTHMPKRFWNTMTEFQDSSGEAQKSSPKSQLCTEHSPKTSSC